MTKMQRYQLSALLLACFASLCIAATPLHEIPSTGEEWMSLADGTEFQPSAIKGDAAKQKILLEAQKRFLEGDDGSSSSSSSSSGSSSSSSSSSASDISSRTSNSELFVDSQNTYYDAYMQAWRYLGFYIDCSPARNLGQRHRMLENDERVGCQRYLIWAAYIDLDYEGGGIGEYQYYDTAKGAWDENACDTNGNGRCAYMDCHLSDTNWSLMGFFKEPEYTEFFEQLFKHQGYCLWENYADDTPYDFMYENYDSWPEDCTSTGTYSELNELLYYELMPQENGNMTVGLYTDYRCRYEYTGGQYSAKNLLQNSGLITGDYEDYWNDAMGVYKICQPCRAYNLYADGRRKKRGLEDDWSHSDNSGYFACNDAAGYTDVNQCMKFRTKTEMQYAPFHEVVKASSQGGMIGVTVQGVTYGQQEYSALRTDEEVQPADRTPLRKASVVLGLGVGGLIGAGILMRARRRSNGSLDEPLVSSSGMIA